MNPYGNIGSNECEQQIEYEEVLDDADQFIDKSGISTQHHYYEDYIEDGASNPIPGDGDVCYEHVIEEKPTIIRSTAIMHGDIKSLKTPTFMNNLNFDSYNQERFSQYNQLPLRSYTPTQFGLPRKRVGNSMIYTSQSLTESRHGAITVSGSGTSTNPFVPNFMHIFGRTSKPAKIRKSSGKKKPCNCTKSMCLKLYCDCFANGEFCLDCNCKDCHNNLEHEAERSRAIKSSLERNPGAFKPKIGVAAKAGKTIDMERLHQRGCHCKKSNCLKNYCECYEAKVPCTERCKCQSCRNTEHDRHNKFKDKFITTAGGLAQLAAAAAADSRARSGSPYSDFEGSDVVVEGDDQQKCQFNPKSQPWFYMTEDVLETTTMCLVAQAQEFEQTLTEDELEKSVLKEFGRCIEQIIESASSCNLQNQQP